MSNARPDAISLFDKDNELDGGRTCNFVLFINIEICIRHSWRDIPMSYFHASIPYGFIDTQKRWWIFLYM